MKESYGEGPATRTGPESCAAVQRSVDRGRGGGEGPLTHCCHERLLLRVRGTDSQCLGRDLVRHFVADEVVVH